MSEIFLKLWLFKEGIKRGYHPFTEFPINFLKGLIYMDGMIDIVWFKKTRKSGRFKPILAFEIEGTSRYKLNTRTFEYEDNIDEVQQVNKNKIELEELHKIYKIPVVHFKTNWKGEYTIHWKKPKNLDFEIPNFNPMQWLEFVRKNID